MRGVFLALLVLPVAAIRPKFSWDTLGNMTFFHSCNFSGQFSSAALDTIQKFPFVTIEKGQGFQDGSAPCSAAAGMCAEEKIIAQIRAIKARDATISTVFYMNSVLDWYAARCSCWRSCWLVLLVRALLLVLPVLPVLTC